MKKNYLIILILSVLSVFAQSQKLEKPYISFERISTENLKIEKGLSQNSVFTIFQDTKGYMWFGTWDGLNKFDGYEFTVYRPSSSEKSKHLSGETISALFEDVHQNLWVGTERGLSKFDNKNQRFIDLSIEGNIGSINQERISEITGCNNGIIWIGTDKGLYKYAEDKGSLIHYPINDKQNSFSDNNIRKLLLQNMTTLWVGTNNGLFELNIDKGEFTNYNCKSLPILLSDTINDIVIDNNLIWLATPKGLCKYDIDKGIVGSYTQENSPLKNNDIRALLIDSKNRLWIGTFGGGLYLMEPGQEKLFKYEFSATESKSIGSNYIYSLYEDEGGIIWVGTRKGVSKINMHSYKFNYFNHSSHTNRSLNSDIIWGFYEDEIGNLWIATDNGINIYEKKTKRFRYIKHQKGNENSLVCNDTRCLMVDDAGHMWIGTNCGGVNKYDIKNDKFTLINKANSKLSSNVIWDIKQDFNKNIWIATDNGLNLLPNNLDTIIVFKHSDNKWKNSIAGNLTYNILPDSTFVWVATDKGISSIDINTLNIRNYELYSKNSVSPNRVFSIFKDSDGIFWIGTINGGLNRFDPFMEEFKNYTQEEDGLPNNVVYNVLEDDYKNLWISTNFGLTKFNKKTEIFVNFDVRDGLQSNEFNLGAAYRTKSGEMIFGGMNGFNTFHPDQLMKNDYQPKILITSFEVQNEIMRREYEDLDSIFLTYNTNFFSFKFAGLDFSKPYKIRYAYKLENFNEDWIYTDASKRFAEYTDVKPGNYIFRVKCTNSDGVMNKGIKIYIHIKPPWWRTYTFWVPFILFVVFITSNYLYFRIKRLKQKNEMQAKMLQFEKQLFDLEQKALRLQMNPHFIFNSLNSIQSFILGNNRDKAVRYLSKFAKLMRLILYNTKESFINFTDEIKSLTYYLELEKLRFDSKFEFAITIDKLLDADFITIPPMLVQPYVENAILHGVINKKDGIGLIEISFIQEKDCIQCVIADNGIGREKAAELKKQSGLKHKSRSMSITSERLDIMNRQRKGKASVTIIDLYEGNTPKGTKVIIDIPFKC